MRGRPGGAENGSAQTTDGAPTAPSAARGAGPPPRPPRPGATARALRPRVKRFPRGASCPGGVPPPRPSGYPGGDPPPRPLRPRPSVSVVVPVHNGGAAFARCAAALARALGPSDELVVVADGETDGAWRALPPTPAAVRTLVLPDPGGPARARNRGADAARGDVLLFVDADVVVRPDTVDRVRAWFAGPGPDGRPAPAAVVGSYDAAPGDGAFLSQYRNLLHHWTHQTAGDTLSTFWAGCGAVRRDVFWEAGGFNEGYARPSIEDVELGYRLTDAGHRVALDPALQVQHLKAWTAADMVRTDVLRRAAPWAALLLRRGGAEDRLNVDRRSRWSVLAVAGLGVAAAAAPLRPRWAARGGAAAAGVFLTLNAPFYRYLARVRGVYFALCAVPWHAVYAACSGLGAALALGGAARPPSPPRPVRGRTLADRHDA